MGLIGKERVYECASHGQFVRFVARGHPEGDEV
jgi:hypothetical protein